MLDRDERLPSNKTTHLDKLGLGVLCREFFKFGRNHFAGPAPNGMKVDNCDASGRGGLELGSARDDLDHGLSQMYQRMLDFLLGSAPQDKRTHNF
jgi:hypothetical protein